MAAGPDKNVTKHGINHGRADRARAKFIGSHLGRNVLDLDLFVLKFSLKVRMLIVSCQARE
jgi:hypothetical protein